MDEPPARTSKPQFRIDAAWTLIENESPPRGQLSLTRMATAQLGKDVIDFEDLTVTVGSGPTQRTLFDDVTWRIGRGTTWTPTPWPRSRTPWTSGPAP